MTALCIKRLGMECLFVAGMLFMSCSSAPDPQPEPSKQTIQQDSDRFFHKMGKEESNPSPSMK